MLKVFIYWNITRGVWSVRALQGDKRGRVIAHVNELTLTDCVFKVSERGRQMVLAQKVKNVHAGVVGFMHDDSVDVSGQHIDVTYNPYKFSTFVNRADHEQPVLAARIVKMNHNRSVQAFV
jgi:hypothetical protein